MDQKLQIKMIIYKIETFFPEVFDFKNASVRRFFLATYHRKITHLGWSGNLKPSKDHAIEGVGFPDALHLSDTVGPGCSVCSMNVYSMIGGASINRNHGV